jgi:peptidoglycan hydrolase-like protein with peptidoglycan-binding domain
MHWTRKEIEYEEGQHCDAIATYQTTLQELGYLSDTYDPQGVFDDETRIAVKNIS